MRHKKQHSSTDAEKSNNTSVWEAVAAKEPCDGEEDLHLLEAVAHGLNVMVPAIYLFAITLVFAFYSYICLLLFRIFRHAFVTSYVNDV